MVSKAMGTADKFNPMSGGRVQYPGVVLEKPAPEQSAAEWAQRLACRQGPDKKPVSRRRPAFSVEFHLRHFPRPAKCQR
jgi:poly(3-hydroxybutyrate) depolymerase